VLAGDDAGDERATSAEPTAPGLIGFRVIEQWKPSATDQILVVVAPIGGRGQRHSPSTAKRPNPVPQAAQVMTQVKLPPCRGPRSPLDLVAIKIIFGRIFEAFQ
jgi:hypothetical protein